jgi:riboflavin synthase alpha subunit
MKTFSIKWDNLRFPSFPIELVEKTGLVVVITKESMFVSNVEISSPTEDISLELAFEIGAMVAGHMYVSAV